VIRPVTFEMATPIEGYGRFCTEASTIGLPPGVVPKSLATTMGNGNDFWLVSVYEEVFIYRQNLGCIELHVVND